MLPPQKHVRFRPPHAWNRVFRFYIKSLYLFRRSLTGGTPAHMLRPAFGARLPGIFPQRFQEIAMADPHERNGENERKPSSADDADLSARLKSLDARISQASVHRAESEPRLRPKSDSSAIGQAFRYSAEFVSGVLAGGIVGWLVDRLFGTSPWGLIICLILGFCAGMLNLLRASGTVKPARYDDKK
jgi:ATP synthase protein I